MGVLRWALPLLFKSPSAHGRSRLHHTVVRLATRIKDRYGTQGAQSMEDSGDTSLGIRRFSLTLSVRL